MFENIKITASFFLAIGIFAALVLFIGAAFEEDSAGVFVIAGLGCAATAWMQYILLGGFADIISNTAKNRDNTEQLLALLRETHELKRERPVVQAQSEQMAEDRDEAPSFGRHRRVADVESSATATQAIPVAVDAAEAVYVGGAKVRCKECGTIQRAGRNVCWDCGAKFE